MDRTYTQKLIDERNAIWTRAKEIMDTATAENRDLTAEEDANLASTNADLDSRDARIKELQRLEERGAIADAARNLVVASAKNVPSDERAIRSVLKGEQRFADLEVRALEGGTSFSPTDFYGQMAVYQRTLNPTIGLANIIRRGNSNGVVVPRLTADPTTYTPGQGTAITPADPTISSVTITPITYLTLTAFSNELAEDESVNLMGILAQSAGRSVGLAAGTALTTGTYGFITTGTNGGTASGTPFFDADDLIGLQMGRAAGYRNSPTAAWQMSNSAITKVRKFKSTTGEYLFQPSLAAGQPDMFLGRPLHENPAMATAGSASKSVAFGDFRAYTVVEVDPIRVSVSTDYGFNTNSTYLRVDYRVGGNLPDAAAIAYLVSGNS